MRASSHQIPSTWSERGYVPPDQLNINSDHGTLQKEDQEDEKGEAAYMRCFHESSKIGRVPNAAFFVNSPTARAYLERRDKELFPLKEASGDPIPNPDLPSWSSRRDSAGATAGGSQSQQDHARSPYDRRKSDRERSQHDVSPHPSYLSPRQQQQQQQQQRQHRHRSSYSSAISVSPSTQNQIIPPGVSPQPTEPQQQLPTPAPSQHQQLSADHARIPWSMEPRTSASGPPNKFR